MTTFGLFTVGVLTGGTAVGIVAGIVAIAIGDPLMAWMAGGLTFMPLSMVFGRVWAKGDMRRESQ